MRPFVSTYQVIYSTRLYNNKEFQIWRYMLGQRMEVGNLPQVTSPQGCSEHLR